MSPKKPVKGSNPDARNAMPVTDMMADKADRRIQEIVAAKQQEGLGITGSIYVEIAEAASASVKVNNEDMSNRDVNWQDQTGPFWHASDEVGRSTEVDKLMVDFTLKDAHLETQTQTTYYIKGRSTPYNNPGNHFRGAPIFEEYLHTAKGQGVRFLIQFLRRRQNQRKLIFRPESMPIPGDEEGNYIAIPQRDSLDGYVAYMQDGWKDKIVHIFDSERFPLTEHPIFCALRDLVRMEKSELYDGYIFTLIILFSWFEIENDERLKEFIDDHINGIWLYKDEVKLHDIRERCLLYGSFFQTKTPTGIKQAIIDQIVKVNARPIPGRHTAVTPERREVSRITINYRPKLLFDDWTIDLLITSFFKSISEKNVKFDETDDQIHELIRQKFLLNHPTLGKPVEMSFIVGVRILYDDRVLEVFGLKKDALRPEELIATKGKFKLTLIFKSCTSDSTDEPRLTYIIDVGNKRGSISDTIRPITSFDTKLAHKLLNEYFDEEEAMTIYIKLLRQLSGNTGALDSSFNSSPDSSPTNSPVQAYGKSRFRTALSTYALPIQAQSIPLIEKILHIRERVEDTQDAVDAAKEYADVCKAAADEAKRELDALQMSAKTNNIDEEELASITKLVIDTSRKATDAKKVYETKLLIAKTARDASDSITKQVATKDPRATEAKKAYDLMIDAKKAYELMIAANDNVGAIRDAVIQTTQDADDAVDNFAKTLATKRELKVGQRNARIQKRARRSERKEKANRKKVKAAYEAKYGKSGSDFLARTSSSDSSSSSSSSLGKSPSDSSDEEPEYSFNPEPDEPAFGQDDIIKIENGNFTTIALGGFSTPSKRVTFEIRNADGSIIKPDQKPTTATKFGTQPFEALMYGLNVLDVSEINLDDPRFRENGDTVTGLYPHQIKVIETIGEALAQNRESTLILEAGVGAGKTTVTLGVARFMELFTKKNQGDPRKRPFLIYAATSKDLLRDFFLRCASVSLSVVGIAHTALSYQGKPGIIFRTPGKGSDAKFRAEPTELNRCSVVVCHVRTLIYLLQLLEEVDERGHPKATNRPYSIIIDEISVGEGGSNASGRTNTNNEHALGAVLAFRPQTIFRHPDGTTIERKINIAIFSASVKGDGPIRYFTSQSNGVKFVNNSTILVPTTLRQLGKIDENSIDNALLDPFLGYADPFIIKKVKEDAFFRRFISNENNEQLKSIITLTTTDRRRRSDIEALAKKTEAYFAQMDEYFVTENSVIYNMYSDHAACRELMPQKFATIEYDDMTEEQKKLAKTTYYAYLGQIGPMSSRVLSMCGEITSFCENTRTELGGNGQRGGETETEKRNTDTITRLDKLAQYIQFIVNTFNYSRDSFVEYHNNRIFDDPARGKIGVIDRKKFDDIMDGFCVIMDKHDRPKKTPNGKRINIIEQNIESLRSLQYWASIQKIIPISTTFKIRYLARYEDELNIIRNCKYYAMIGTRDQKELMVAIYSPIATKISILVKQFYETNILLFNARTEHHISGPINPREILAKTLHDQYLQALNSEEDMQFDLIRNGKKRIVRSFEDWLNYMYQKNINDTVKRQPFLNIGKSEAFRNLQAKAIQESKKRDKNFQAEESDEEGLGGKTAKRTGEKQITLLVAWDNYQRHTESVVKNSDTLSQLIHELNQICDLIVKQHMFHHAIPVHLTKETIEKAKSPESIYAIFGVYAPIDSTDIPEPRDRKHNRLFCNKGCARGLDIPLEAIIFTQSVDEDDPKDPDAFTADDILQMSGRCGRPSKSSTSVVYMASSTYYKCLTGKATDDIINVLLRYKYYRQPPDAKTIDEPILQYDEYKEMRIYKLLKDVSETQSF